jgi:RES domain-containing protein
MEWPSGFMTYRHDRAQGACPGARVTGARWSHPGSKLVMFTFRAMNTDVLVSAQGDEEAIAAQVAATFETTKPEAQRPRLPANHLRESGSTAR